MPRRNPPLFVLVRKELEAWIQERGYRPGDRLPSEQELSEILRTSRATVREAFRTMEEDGIIVRSQGKGTFLANRRIKSILEANLGVTEMIEAMGYESGTLGKIVRRKKAGLFLAEKLKVSEASDVVLIERVRTANSRPVTYSTDVIPWWVLNLKGLVIKDLEGCESIYRFLEDKCGQVIGNCTARLFAVNSAEIAEKFNLHKETALFAVEQIDVHQNGQPILYSREYYAGDIFEFRVHRKRIPNLLRGNGAPQKFTKEERSEG